MQQFKQIAKNVRKKIVRMSHYSKSAHLAPSLSCADILVALYFGVMKEGDRFILSKGHGAMAAYAVLSEKGIIPEEWLEGYSLNGGRLGEHPSPDIPGVDVETGSLGHGLSVAVGAAIGRKIKGNRGREFVLLGDGECQEGTVWEAAAFASHRNLDNIVAVVDRNKFQAIDRCENVMNRRLYDQWYAFGWNVIEIDGHDVDDLVFWLDMPSRKPKLILANTIKGKGISFAENNLEWHYRVPNKEELEQALKEIEES